MTLRQLLGKALKSNEVLEVLRVYDLDVIYKVDVLQENIPDHYYCESPEGGFDLRFDEHQILTTAFCYTIQNGDRSAIERNLIGAPIYASFESARSAGESLRIKTHVGENIRSLGRTLSFVRLDHADHSVHYEYVGGTLVMITLMMPRDAVT